MQSGLLELDPAFVPPLVNIHASDYLAAISRRLVEILVAKSESLATPAPKESESGRLFRIRDRQLLVVVHGEHSFAPNCVTWMKRRAPSRLSTQ